MYTEVPFKNLVVVQFSLPRGDHSKNWYTFLLDFQMKIIEHIEPGTLACLLKPPPFTCLCCTKLETSVLYRFHTKNDSVNKSLRQLSLRCVTYLYYDPNLNCCYEEIQKS